MIVRFRRGHFRQRRPSLTPRWLCKFYFLKSFLVVPTAIATAAFKKRNGCPARRQQHSFQRRLRSCDRGAYCCIAACGGNSTGLVLLPPETKHRQQTRGTCRNNRNDRQSHACCRGSTGCFIWDLVCSVCNSCASWRCVLLNLHWYCSCERAACLPVSAKT